MRCGCLLWIHDLIDILPQVLQVLMQYPIIFDGVITALNCTYNLYNFIQVIADANLTPPPPSHFLEAFPGCWENHDLAPKKSEQHVTSSIGSWYILKCCAYNNTSWLKYL